MKNFKRFFVLFCLIVLSSSVFVYADNETDEDEDYRNNTEQETYVHMNPVVDESGKFLFPTVVTIKNISDTKSGYDASYGFFDFESEELMFTQEEGYFTTFMDEVLTSIRKEAKTGLDALSKSNTTIDYIRLDTWGEFLNKYYGKTINSFPLGDIHFKYNGYDFLVKNTVDAKSFILDYMIPRMTNEIVKLSTNYPAKFYNLNSSSGALLKDYTCDLTNVTELYTLYPLNEGKEYQFFNTGSYYGMALDSKYVEILRGYIESDGYNRRVDLGDGIPGCVSVLAYIVCLRDISFNSLSESTVFDYLMYKNLAIQLDTKTLIDVTDMNTASKKIDPREFSLDLDNLVVYSVSDGVVVIQPTYLLCFNYGGIDSNFNCKVDISSYILEGSDTFNVVGSNETIKAKYFSDEDGILGTRLGNAPFLIYYTSYVPYDKLVNFAYNQQNLYFDYFPKQKTEMVNNFVDIIRQDLKGQDRQKDFDAYMKGAGQQTDGMRRIIKIAIFAIVIIVIGVAALMVKIQYDKVNAPTEANTTFVDTTNEVLFDDDDDDEDGSNFELK